MAGLPSGASGMLCRDHRGKKTDRLVTRIDTGVVSLVAELCGHQSQAAEEVEQWKTRVEEHKVIDASPAAISLARICDLGKDRGDGAQGVGAATGIGTGAEGLSMSAVSLRQQLFTVWKCHHSRRYGHRPL
jgi:hypothetical protein